MSYLIQNDYKKIIQSDNLLQLIGNDFSILSAIQIAAQSECISYLTQKYDTSQEFTDTTIWSFTTAYKARSRVYLDATAYDATKTYPLNSLTLQAGNVYICTTAISVAEAFTVGKWTMLGPQYALFYVTYPKPPFDFYQYYAKGDQVFWKDKTYTALIASTTPSHEALLQGGTYANVPNSNVFPNDPTSGINYWGTGAAYTINVGTLPTDTTKWTAGDNRNPQLVNYCIDIALYHIHSRIAPRNIPELRVKRRDEAVMWLKDAAQGNYITANLPLIQPKRGGRIRFGGNVKAINTF